MRSRPLVVAYSAVLVMALPVVAQVEARQAKPNEASQIESGNPGAEGDVEVPNPMLLEVKISTAKGANPLSAVDQGKIHWYSSATKKFVVDRARVSRVYVHTDELNKKKGHVNVIVMATVASGWFRQDLDFTLQLLGPDGKELARRHWDNETVGNDSGVTWGGRTKQLSIEWDKAPLADRKRLGAGDPLSVRMLLEVQDEEGDEDAD